MQDGKRGEVVFTTLTRRGMPLIRYRTGDVSRFVPGDCPCGTVLKTLERVRGRIGGSVEIGAAYHLTMADLDEALFPIAGMLDFSATLTRERGGDRLHIEAIVVDAPGRATPTAIQRQLFAVPSIRSAREMGRLNVRVDVRIADWGNEAARRLSKRRIVDRRDP